ncbi:hypothetical protein T439DRAFT_381872 [Meredithblackwellia eburnea MCA 4105]
MRLQLHPHARMPQLFHQFLSDSDEPSQSIPHSPFVPTFRRGPIPVSVYFSTDKLKRFRLRIPGSTRNNRKETDDLDGKSPERKKKDTPYDKDAFHHRVKDKATELLSPLDQYYNLFLDVVKRSPRCGIQKLESLKTEITWTLCSPVALLLSPVGKCIELISGTPAINQLSHEYSDFYVRRKIVKGNWAKLRPLEMQAKFYVALDRLTAKKEVFQPQPNFRRVINSEADTKDAFLLKYLNSIPQIFNAMLSSGVKKKFEIMIFNEASLTMTHPNYGNKLSKPKVDLALMLVSYRTTKGSQTFHHMHPLILIELKKPKIVRLNDWASLDENLSTTTARYLNENDKSPAKILPQILMYANAWQCHRLYFADSNNVVAIDVEPLKIRAFLKELRIGFRKCGEARKPDSVYDLGAKLAIAFDVFAALHELGALDNKLFPEALRTSQPQPAFDEKRLQRYGDD